MSTSLTFLSAIIGTDIAFEVTLSNIQSVHDLKEQIIAENEQALGSFDATSLTLFKVKIDVSQGNFKNMMKDISRGSVFFHRQELDLPSVKLCDIFQETDLPRLSIHILIKLPAAPPILPQPPRGLKREAIASFADDHPAKRRTEYGISPPLTGPGDPVINHDFLLTGLPLASYCAYWGKGINNVVEKGQEFRPNSLPPLYVFAQYGYMRERIDAFRSQPQNTTHPPGVAIIGTPGIGKTCFLDYYLACELAQSKPAVYYQDGTCYIFVGDTNGCRVYASEKVPHFTDGFHNILCLVDADTSNPAPDHLLKRSPLFVMMAAPPRKVHTHLWMKQRAHGRSRLFVMNPPSEDELVRALGIRGVVDSSASEEKIRLAFQLYGPNMRTLIRAIESPADEKTIRYRIATAVEALPPDDLRALFTFPPPVTVEIISQTLATTLCLKHPEPDEGGYLVDDCPRVVFAGPIVWNALVRAHGAAVYVELTHLLSVFSSMPQSRGFSGWVWEHWVHAQMIKGGLFTLHRIYFPSNTEHIDQVDEPPAITTISIPPLTPRYFNEKEQFPHTTSEYFIPNKKTNAAFDSLLFLQARGIGIHVTIGPTHSLNEDGSKNLWTRLRDPHKSTAKPWFVAVTPKGQSFSYSPRPSQLDLKRFFFFRLELDMPNGVLPIDMTRQPGMSIYPEVKVTEQPEGGEMSEDEN